MDLTAEFDAVSTEPVLLTNVEYEVEEIGHEIDTPVFHVRSRTASGDLVTTEVEGFRPHFGITQADFMGDALEVCNDRRTIGVEVDCSPKVWQHVIGIDNPGDVTAEDVAHHLEDTFNTEVYHTPDPYTTLHGDAVARIYTRVPGDVGGETGLRGDLDCETLEADVPFTRRFLISSGIYQSMLVDTDKDRVRYENWEGESDSPGLTQEVTPCDPPEVNPRHVIYDIEVATEGDGFPQPDRARHPITSISAHDSYTDEYCMWGLVDDVWDADKEQLKQEVYDDVRDREGFPDDTDTGDAFGDFQLFEDETMLLESFHRWVLEHDPDIFTGYNSDGFDHPYLIQRSYNVQALSIKRYSDNATPGVWVEEYDGNRQVNYSLSGRCTLDILDAYKKTQYRELDSYKLDDVASAELGFGKVGLEGDELDEAWHDHPVEFYAYSLRDSQATVEVEAQAGLFDLFENLRHVTGAQYETAVSNGPMLDTLFLRRAYEDGLMLPSNTAPDETVFHGAKVFDPVPGIHQNCVYPDLSSLYPNLFAMLNLGEETIIGTREDLRTSEFTTEDCYTFPTDERDFAIVPKGEPIDHIDRSEYKGVKTPGGGVREMFAPEYTTMYVLKPDIKESFIRDTIDDLIDLKYEYAGNPQRYAAVKRVTNSCFTPDTEVMTPDGIKGIRELEVGDRVYSIDPDTKEVEIKPVTATQSFPDYDGELVNIETNKIDFSVTPDHDMVVKQARYDDDVQKVEAGNLNAWSSYEMISDWNTIDADPVEEIDLREWLDKDEYESRTVDGDVQIRPHQNDGRVHTWHPATYDANRFIELLAWYITEGSTRTKANDGRKRDSVLGLGSNTISIAQYDDDEKADIAETVEELSDNMSPRVGDRSVGIYNHKLLSAALIRMAGDGSENKRLPSFVWDCSVSQKQTLFNVLIRGDGDRRDTSYRYTTKSTELRDDVMRLCVHLGKNPQYSWDDGGEYNSGVWRVFYSDTKNHFRMNRSRTAGAGSTTTAENGVYCVTVEDNHTVLAGRNGKFQWVAQCYGVMGDSASGGKGFRLYNRRVAEGITLAGRQTITHTASEFTEYLQQNYDPGATLVGGDTDSSTTSIPNAPDMNTALDWAREAVEYVEQSYDEFANNEFDMPAEDHRLEVELESLASALFYSEESVDEWYEQTDSGLVKNTETHGVQKRYAQSIVWDDDDGWLDVPDGEPLFDPDDTSELKFNESVTYDTFTDGALSHMDPQDIVSITGFEYVRSDSAQITRDAQENIFTHILISENPRDRIETYLQNLVEGIEDGTVPLSKLARPKGISQHLDSYGWKDVSELSDDEVTPEIEHHGGVWRQTPGPNYRGAKYADDWFSWEQLGEGSKPHKIPIDKVRGSDFPAAYEYHSYPEDNARPDPPEVGTPVDAVSVENPERLPEEFIVDRDTIIEKELEDKLEDVLQTLGYSFDDVVSPGQQTSLGAFG